MWQPIETAPKDQPFLAVLNCAGEQTICTMRWAVATAKNSRPDHDVFHIERVTHWMPLPALTGTQPTQRMNMQTADQVTQAFKSELQALLDKYGAELSARDKWEGYPECGEDVRMQVDVPAIYDADHNCLREYTEIDLGSWVLPTQAMPKEAKP